MNKYHQVRYLSIYQVDLRYMEIELFLLDELKIKA